MHTVELLEEALELRRTLASKCDKNGWLAGDQESVSCVGNRGFFWIFRKPRVNSLSGLPNACGMNPSWELLA